MLPATFRVAKITKLQQIFQSDFMIDYEELLICVEGHIICNEKTFLHKKVGRLVCHYKAPWDLCDHSKLYLDQNWEKIYEPRRNDDRLNTQNCETLDVEGYTIVCCVKLLLIGMSLHQRHFICF